MARPVVGASVCVTHKRHAPHNLTLDWHHIIPRDWQRQWAPPGAAITHDATYGDMWDTEGIWICPTGHHNVHRCIVTLMHGDKPVGTLSERAVAKQALDKFVGAGGDLEVLRKAGCWGQM